MDMIGPKARPVALIHRIIRRFDTSREKLGIEQRSGAAIVCQFVFDRRQSLRIGGKLNRQLSIGVPARGDQFSQTNRL